MVPFLQNGIPAQINPDNIRGWKSFSGKSASGVLVQSIEAATIGDSILLRHSAGGPVLSVSKEELEVFTQQYLADNSLPVQGMR
jgi:hypothetical protein